jgi:hypothetical protein
MTPFPPFGFYTVRFDSFFDAEAAFGCSPNRHSVMNLGNHRIRLRDDHRARFQRFAGRAILPFIPKARERDNLTVGAREIVRLFAAGRVLPLVVTGRGDDAGALKCLTKERLARDRFNARVERGEP